MNFSVHEFLALFLVLMDLWVPYCMGNFSRIIAIALGY